jgi:predicted MFS family arabinose efflux permease
MNVALPVIARTYGTDAKTVQWIVVGYLITLTASLVVVGPIGDRYGRRRLLLAGLVATALGLVGSALAPGLGWLIAGRALWGIGSALLASMSIALVTDVTESSGAGSALGVLATASALATMFGPTLGGLAIQFSGWRAIPLVVLVPALVLLVVTARVVPDVAAARAGSMLDLGVLRNRRLVAGLLAAGFVGASMIATLVVAPFVLTGSMRFSPAAAGFVLAIGPLIVTLLAVPAGRAADRLGPRPVVVGALLALALGMLGLAASVHASIVAFIAALALASVGYALFQTPNSLGVMAEAGARRGAVASWLNVARNVGFIIGASGLSALYTDAGPAASFVAASCGSAAALAVTLALAFGPRHVEGDVAAA